MRIGIGLGLDSNPEQAAREAAQQALRGIPKPNLILAFGSSDLDQKKVYAGLSSVADLKVLVGGSSYAEITPAGVTRRSVAVLALRLEGARTAVAEVDMDQSLKEGISRVMRQASLASHSSGLFPVGLFISGYNTEMGGKILSSFGKDGRTPIFGGISCGHYDKGMSHPDFWLNYQYGAQGLKRHSALLSFLGLPRGRYKVAFGYEHGWEPVGPPITLTRCKGNRVYEAGGMPIFDYYRQFLGREESNEFFELMIQRYAFAIRYGDANQSRWVLKLPAVCNVKEGFIEYYPSEKLEGRTVRMIQASRLGLIDGARQAALRCRQALKGEAALVLMVSCCTRGSILHSRLNDEVQAVRSVFGKNVPVFGYYSGGEILPFLSRYEDVINTRLALSGSHHHTATMGLLAISAKGKVHASALPEIEESPLDLAQTQTLLASAEKNLDKTESFLANFSRKSHEDGERIRKQNEIIYRYTPHDVWIQIGNRVAKGQYELPDAEFSGYFLFMDVKGFTAFSETHSSKKVVETLNELFAPATEIIYRHKGEVDKFIGDCIFAAFRDAGRAVEAGRDLLKLFRNARRRGHPFNVRIGINGGRAVRANLGSQNRREYTYIGDAVNLAQRLESNCTPGKLLLASGVYHQCKTKFFNVQKRSLMVKGKIHPVAAFECWI